MNRGGLIGALTGFRGIALGGTRMRRQKKSKQRKMAQRKRSTTRRFSR
jgi:U3 small nucleolar ribonucleoprotein component